MGVHRSLLPRERRRDCLDSRRLPLSAAATLAVDGPDGCDRERQDEGRDAAGCFCGSLCPPGARNAAHGKIASLVSPRISMSGFSTERPPRARTPRQERTEIMLHDASSSPSSPCPFSCLGLPHLLNLSKRL